MQLAGIILLASDLVLLPQLQEDGVMLDALTVLLDGIAPPASAAGPVATAAAFMPNTQQPTEPAYGLQRTPGLLLSGPKAAQSPPQHRASLAQVPLLCMPHGSASGLTTSAIHSLYLGTLARSCSSTCTQHVCSAQLAMCMHKPLYSTTMYGAQLIMCIQILSSKWQSYAPQLHWLHCCT